MFRNQPRRFHRSLRSNTAALLLGGTLTLLTGPLSWERSWESLWASVFSWLGGQPGVAVFSESSSGIDPDGRPERVEAGSADSDSSSDIDPNGRPR